MVTRLLDEVRSRGVILAVSDGGLVCEGPASVLTPGLIRELRGHKSEILGLMRCQQCTAALAGPTGQWWRIEDGERTAYLCSAQCALGIYPWELGVDNAYRG